MSSEPDGAQTLTMPAPFDFDETLRFTRFGPGDPTARRGAGWFLKAWLTPVGAVTLRLECADSEVKATAWGPGTAWALSRLPALLGLHDRPDACRPGPPLTRIARQFAGLRLARVPWPLDKLLAYILQQRVPFDAAATSWRMATWRFGEQAPGPEPLRLAPAAATLLRLGDYDWRLLGVDRQRQAALRDALRYAHRVQETADMELQAVRQRLRALRGVGPWTTEITLGFGFGDPDAVPTGDYHLPHMVAWSLAGEPRGGDARMLELLEPYAGQRFRILRWLFAAKIGPPRRGPRMPLPRPADGWPPPT